MTAGLEVVSSILFYFGQLRPGDSDWILTPRDGSQGTLRHMKRLLSTMLMKESVDSLFKMANSFTETLEKD